MKVGREGDLFCYSEKFRFDEVGKKQENYMIRMIL